MISSPRIWIWSCRTTRSFPGSYKALADIGLKRVFDPEKIVVVIDHWVPATSPAIAEIHKLMRQQVKELGIRHFYDVGVGIEHNVVPENGHALPGELIVGSDSHSTTYGALGAASTGIGLTETAYAMVTGQLWFQVPPTIRFELEGTLVRGVTPKDLMLALLGRFGTQVAQYKAVEFAGPAADSHEHRRPADDEQHRVGDGRQVRLLRRRREDPGVSASAHRSAGAGLWPGHGCGL